ncbi:MAG: TetR/AcrR family transcriptional regulator [Gemmatimonadales bacterium]
MIRTRAALSVALVELMVAQGFDDITVQQVLDRARVGRATFYAHFRSKQDLLLSDAERFCEMLERQFLAKASGSRRLAPVAELFTHVREYHRFLGALQRSSMNREVFDLLTGYLARIITARISMLAPAGRAGTLSPAATARVLAAALTELMGWWLERGAPQEPEVMDAQFHELAWGGLARTLPVGAPQSRFSTG